MDFLGYACSFVMLVARISKLFRKRMGIIKSISHIYDRKNWTYIFGYFKNIKSNRYLNFSEILEKKFHEAENLYNLDSNFILKKNSSNDISELVKEITQKHLNEFDYKKVNFDLQHSFWKNYSKIPRTIYENKKEFRKHENRICNSFLENNKYVLGL